MGGSRLQFPLHKYRKLSLLWRQSHWREQRRELRYIHGDHWPLTFLQKSWGALPAPFGDCAHIAKQAPTIPPRAVESCILAALQRSNPARSRIAKSPTYKNQEPTVNKHSQSEDTLNKTSTCRLFLTFHISGLPEESFQRDKRTSCRFSSPRLGNENTLVTPSPMARYKALSPHVVFHGGEWPSWLGTQPTAEEKRCFGNSPSDIF